MIVLLDDPSGTTVSTSEGSRDALPGEAHHFTALAEALSRHTHLPVEVRAPGAALDPGTAVVVHVSQLDRLAGSPARVAVVDVPRAAISSILTTHPTAVVVEHHQYWKWKTGGPADAAVYGDLRIVPRLGHEVTVTPLDGDRFGRIRIDGPDLPGLLADCLTGDRC